MQPHERLTANAVPLRKNSKIAEKMKCRKNEVQRQTGVQRRRRGGGMSWSSLSPGTVADEETSMLPVANDVVRESWVGTVCHNHSCPHVPLNHVVL